MMFQTERGGYITVDPAELRDVRRWWITHTPFVQLGLALGEGPATTLVLTQLDLRRLMKELERCFLHDAPEKK